LKYQSLAMKHVRETLNSLNGQPPPDHLIRNVMRLATQGGRLLDSWTEQGLRETPLAEAFCLRLYGRFAIGFTHLQACVSLTRQRGGLGNLPPDIAQPLQL
jgi:hypothetical protein